MTSTQKINDICILRFFDQPYCQPLRPQLVVLLFLSLLFLYKIPSRKGCVRDKILNMHTYAVNISTQIDWGTRRPKPVAMLLVLTSTGWILRIIRF